MRIKVPEIQHYDVREYCNAPVRSRFSFFEEMLPGDPEACRDNAAADCGERAASAAFFFLKSEAPA